MEQQISREERVPEWVKLVMALICDEDVEDTKQMIRMHNSCQQES